MENQEKATLVLDKQISEVQEKITQTKLNIADLFIRTYEMDIRKIQGPKDMLPLVNDVENLHESLNSLKEQEKVFAALTKSRAEIEAALMGVIVK